MVQFVFVFIVSLSFVIRALMQVSGGRRVLGWARAPPPKIKIRKFMCIDI